MVLIHSKIRNRLKTQSHSNKENTMKLIILCILILAGTAFAAFSDPKIERWRRQGEKTYIQIGNAAGTSNTIALNGDSAIDSSSVFYNNYRYVWLSGIASGSAPVLSIICMAGQFGTLITAQDTLSITSEGAFSALIERQGLIHAYFVYQGETGNGANTQLTNLVISRIE